MSQIIVLAILILINAFFASAEIAFISLNDAKIDIQAKEGNKKAKKRNLKKNNEMFVEFKKKLYLCTRKRETTTFQLQTTRYLSSGGRAMD